MLNLYCTLIINKRRTIEQIPPKFQNPVKEKLNELGYDVNGDQIATEE